MIANRNTAITSVSLTIPEEQVSAPASLSIQATHSTTESPGTCQCSLNAGRIALISGGIGLFIGTVTASALETLTQYNDTIDQSTIGLGSSIAALAASTISGIILSGICCYTSSSTEDSQITLTTVQRESESQFSSSPPSYEDAVGSDQSQSDYLPSYEEAVSRSKILAQAF